MGILEVYVTAVVLALDAFAVSICKGLAVKKAEPKHYLTVGVYFGGFQALMPLIGFLLGNFFKNLITNADHWVAFGLLAIIGVNMIKESFGEEEEVNDSFSVKEMLPLAIATSIDALAVGITLALSECNIWLCIAIIGIITCVISMIGLKIGKIVGDKFKNKAEFIGGLVLIAIGIKIVLEHLGYIKF